MNVPGIWYEGQGPGHTACVYGSKCLKLVPCWKLPSSQHRAQHLWDCIATKRKKPLGLAPFLPGARKGDQKAHRWSSLDFQSQLALCRITHTAGTPLLAQHRSTCPQVTAPSAQRALGSFLAAGQPFSLESHIISLWLQRQHLWE